MQVLFLYVLFVTATASNSKFLFVSLFIHFVDAPVVQINQCLNSDFDVKITLQNAPKVVELFPFLI